MTALIRVLQRIRQTVGHVCQARHRARMAKTPAPRTRRQSQRTSHQARLARSMPEANPLTLEITANILASHGLLDEQPPFKPTVGDTRQCVWLTRAAMGWRR